MSNEDTSLSSLFESAQRQFNSIEASELSCSCAEFQTQVRNCISNLEQCAVMIRQLGILSDNEFVDDMNSLDLRFLLTDYYQGILTLKLTASSSTTASSNHANNNNHSSTASTHEFRIQTLQIALKHLDTFLLTLDTHDALPANAKPFLSSDPAVWSASKDAATNRSAKIERFKREKALKLRLESLQQAVDQARKDAATKSSNSESRNSTVNDEDDFDLRDSEQYREVMLTTLELCVMKCVDEMRVARDEIDMLEQIAKMDSLRLGSSSSASGGGRSAAAAAEALAASRVDDLSALKLKPDSLLSKDGKPRQPFIITNKREAFQKGVFRPGHNLPSMTIDEFLENQMKQGAIISGGGKMPEKVVADDNDEADDIETLKARAMDEFKDANPKGWGNRMNKG
ncbi:hypothetical protein CcCBS67573_g09227 [Chytriomyces confervae]|uniref:TAP42-like protein n=1 Tax=Chytriomyces confervae TaxID=246404 RepID=A0A507E1H5_9FUNG|nr:hypothetical protein CcCBS67573_g09227 [Chytriomyces confervae]